MKISLVIASYIFYCLACIGLQAQAAEENFSHLLTHAFAMPPADLLKPIDDGGSQLKGMEAVLERQLLNGIQSADLRERILKVAIAIEGSSPVALVKVQAGDAQSRLFSLAMVEDDAAKVLNAAFKLPTQLKHVDFWAVIPGLSVDGEEAHRPVFSVAAERSTYQKITKGKADTREWLARLSAVRYDPIFTRYAGDWIKAKDSMPRTAYLAPRIADLWKPLCDEGVLAVNGFDQLKQTHAMLGGVPAGNKVALTIDDGPHPLITPLVLDILRREKVKATFFVVGEKAEEFPGLIREIVREGHEVANHTYSHQRFSTLTPEEIYAQIRGCNKIIGQLTGETVRFIRPPGGDYTPTSLQITAQMGMVNVFWTHNTGDWTSPNPGAIAFQATQSISSGDIILMHQGSLTSARAIPLIIQKIRARGLTPGCLSDIVVPNAVHTGTISEIIAEKARLRLTE